MLSTPNTPHIKPALKQSVTTVFEDLDLTTCVYTFNLYIYSQLIIPHNYVSNMSLKYISTL